MRSLWGILLAFALAGPALADNALKGKILALGGKPCEVSELTCLTLAVPLDSDDPAGPTIDIDFTVHFAEKGGDKILVYAVGGPGQSGLQSIEDYLHDFDLYGRDLNVVFFDQRGIGPKHGVECAQALGLFNLSPAVGLEAALPDIETFAENCIAESGREAIMPYLGTEYAIHDLEAFRQAIGAPHIWIYGESYGTQFAQEYAAAYPGAMAGLVLDGVVDLGHDAKGYYAEDARTADHILDRVFIACDELPACHDDMGGKSAASVYDELAARAIAGRLIADFPLATGERAKRPITLGLLQGAAFYGLYSPYGRAEFLRVLGAAGRGNFVPLLRLAYADLGIDSESEDGISYADFYGAAYYAITCPDYEDAAVSDPSAAADVIFAEAKAIANEAPRLGTYLYAERLVCAYWWPTEGRMERPRTLTEVNFPALILNSDSDPATPVSNGYNVFSRLIGEDVYMVTMHNGPHVIGGRGGECPDAIIFGLIAGERKPDMREQICPGDFLDSYTPLTLTEANDAADPWVLADAIYREITLLMDHMTEDGIGCDFGGTIIPSGTDNQFAYNHCRLWPDIELSGRSESVDSFRFSLTISGAHGGAIDYIREDDTEAVAISGTYDGVAFETPRLQP